METQTMCVSEQSCFRSDMCWTAALMLSGAQGLQPFWKGVS